MKEIPEEEKAMYIYALHIVLYVNDLALNSIKELKPFISEKDKESKKIFGALMKRVGCYDKNLLKILGDNDIWFYADFNGVYDEYFDKNIEGLRRSAEWIFRCNGYTETYYLSKVETAFAMVCLSVSIAESYIQGLIQNGVRTFVLPDYKLTDIKKVYENFYDWTIFLQKKDKIIDLSKYKSIKKYFDKIKTTVIDRSVFEKAYTYALEEENKRKNK